MHHGVDIVRDSFDIKFNYLKFYVFFLIFFSGKRMKPDYALAATELKGQAIIAAIDVNRPENSVVRKQYNITGFPTLLYFK